MKAMNLQHLAICIALCICLLLVFPLLQANCQNYVQYSIQIKSDCSAVWVITQVSDINASIDTWEGFQQRIFNLVDSATNLTQRGMSVDENSLQINNTISSESKTVNYIFTWLNFSVSQNDKIVFGDVFGVKDFFAQLYGDAAVQISYPETYSVKSVNPTPNEQSSSEQTLQWFRTQDFVYSTPNIVLTTSYGVNTNGNRWPLYATAIAGTATVLAAVFAGFYLLQKRKQAAQNQKSVDSPPLIESDEEKIVNLVKASKGNMRQTDITEQCHFSKAKTSQLLAALEQKGIIKRYKKGRDKIVNLTEQRVKSEQK
jgi:uncharacterized membrane protein